MKKVLVFGPALLMFVAFFFYVQRADALTVSQLLPEFTAKPGDTIDQVIQLYDDSLQGVTVYPVIYNFTADPEREGTIEVLTDPADLKPDREWIKFEKTELTLPADGTLVDFPYSIEIPENGEPGTHLISIVFQTKPQLNEEVEGTAVYVGTNVATNIFLKVLGATIDKIDVDFQVGEYTNSDEKLSAAEKKQFFVPKTFFTKPPVDFLVTVLNTGNTHQKPDGNIKIVNDLFSMEAEKIFVNQENRIILPGTDRTFDVSSFGQGLMIGKFRAKITLLYGDPLRPVEKEIVFWIVPVKEICIVVLIIIIIILLIIFIVRRSRKKRDKREQVREEKMRKEIMNEILAEKSVNNKQVSKNQNQKKSVISQKKKNAK